MYIKEPLKSNPKNCMNMVDTCMSKTTAPNEIASDASAPHVIRALPPTKKELRTMRILILIGVASVINFLWWFLDRDHVGNKTLYVLLTAALMYKLLRILHEWYHYWHISVPDKPVATRTYTVDMLTTACPGEPYEMFRRTLTAMQAVRYPHTSYLCDEGNDPALKALCDELGVIHVTRRVKKDAKAGNINNALRFATGELCVVMDPDHEPAPEFLDRVVSYFEKPEIGFVQVVQAYHNTPESLVAKGAAQQTYSFYGPMMMGMNSYGTVQAIGANCTFRREALDSIGGHAAGLSEDMHTAMQLHAKGWQSVYVPEILTRGLVPSSLGAYYKQQLKWSRGTFELLLVTFPRLFRNFTWRQKLHYFLIPLHFLLGLIVLIDLAVPVASLLTSEVPWRIEFFEFVQYYVPVVGLSLLIRQYSQRWLLEVVERGFHVTGGLLLVGTWWVFLLGFVYSLLRVKVPYIPTPKEDKPENHWLLSLPNILVCLVSLAAVAYGLHRDWSPFSFIMAGFTILNVAILSVVIVAGQHKLLGQIKDKVRDTTLNAHYVRPSKRAFGSFRHGVYNLMRTGAPAYAFLMLLLIGASFLANPTKLKTLKTLEPPVYKNTGGFYTGVYMPEVQATGRLQPVAGLQKAAGQDFNIVSLYQAWGPASVDSFPQALIEDIYRKNAVPMITWEPWTNTFPELAGHPELGRNRKVLKGITDGVFDAYLKTYAGKVRALQQPVFLRFAHEFDNPAYPWSPAGGNTPQEFIAAWRHVVKLFMAEGVSNVAWVWNPWRDTAVYDYFPGGLYVDWLGVTCLNYGTASGDGKWRSYEEIYAPYRQKLLSLQKPVMLAEFGSTAYGGDPVQWTEQALQTIGKKHGEIKAAVFFNSGQDQNWATAWRPAPGTQYIDWRVQQPARLAKGLRNLGPAPSYHLGVAPKVQRVAHAAAPAPATHPKVEVTGTAGQYELQVDGKPFYVRGVAYNTAHDWRDGHFPLTRKQIEQDLADIKNMGANTIRRYNPGVYDRNILTVAKQYDLKVWYGFWFDPEVDYYRDSLKVQKYLEEVEETVLAHRNDPTILCWSVGNETWGLLKHQYHQPYLTVVRNAYARMIERMARRIHELDPHRPVSTSFEHALQLPAELASFHQQAPSIDIVGVNSYYLQQISHLNEIAGRFDSTRPYVVSEFGPNGYWDPEYSHFTKSKSLWEASDFVKALYYNKQWTGYVEANRGYNVGGLAFCWRDRLEGTATWFGLTDFKGRRKPAYYTLRKLWTGQNNIPGQQSKYQMHDLVISGPEKLVAGKTYTFTALGENMVYKNFEWYLYKEDYLREAGDVEQLSDEITTKVSTAEPGHYRLYVYVHDYAGNVVTASTPLIVARK